MEWMSGVHMARGLVRQHTTSPRLARVVVGALLAFGVSVASTASAVTMVAPNAQATVEGDARVNSAPFNTGFAPNRYMQIYAASQFGAFSGGMLISELDFRPDATQLTPFSHTFPSVSIFLSTTSQTVAGLSSTFANNIGSNNTLVRSGPLTIASANLPGSGTAKQFDIVIPLTTPFFYNPAAGNLLLDIENFNAGNSGLIDAVSDASASLTRLVFFDGSATASTGTVQGFGIVTQFTAAAPARVPAPGTLLLVISGAALFAGAAVRSVRRHG